MDIRLAEEKDLPAIYELGFDSYSAEVVATYGSVVDKDKCRKIAETMVKNKTVFLAISERNIIGAMLGIFTNSGFDSEVIYNSMFFFMKTEYRKFTKQFINDVENLLKLTTATRFIIGNPEFNNGPEMDRFYSIMGFKKLETHYIKPIIKEVKDER